MRKLWLAAFAVGVVAGLSGSALAQSPSEKDWSASKGKLPFVVGYETGLAEAEFSGRPLMLFFTTTW